MVPVCMRKKLLYMFDLFRDGFRMCSRAFNVLSYFIRRIQVGVCLRILKFEADIKRMRVRSRGKKHYFGI